MFRIAIVDDDKAALSIVSGALDSFFKGKNMEYSIFSFSNPLNYSATIKEEEINLVFLDIDMPEKKVGILNKVIDKSKMFNEDNDLNVGDNVVHDIYGPGVVVMVDKSIAAIAFKGQGVKKMMKNHKSIKKVS